jgi:hypothetical protein
VNVRSSITSRPERPVGPLGSVVVAPVVVEPAVVVVVSPADVVVAVVVPVVPAPSSSPHAAATSPRARATTINRQ